MPGAGLPRHHVSPRRLLARHLAGSGLELGPGHHPFVLPLPGVTVRYVDRWTPDEARRLFPAMGPYAGQPDVIADFNTERLDPVADASQDFLIASHVLEHLAEPLGFMAEMHRVLRRGGVALVLLPDRHRTRDRNRAPTPLDHLVGEYRAGVREVSDDHLLEFLAARGEPVPPAGEERRRVLDRHRRRSVHVHCWDAGEFADVIRWGIENLAEQWEFVDGCLPFDGVPPADIEFGFVLRRSDVDLDGPTRSRRFEASWTAWCDVQRALLPAAGAADLLGRAYQRARHGLYRQVVRRVRHPPTPE
ncbi:MAG TPA: class I SAM-dependent methyltransferase [Acidimicrobiales bacterium]|nr:class I SAM-dependent methyltransferase [Acidimicrobiales bacterium]